MAGVRVGNCNGAADALKIYKLISNAIYLERKRGYFHAVKNCLVSVSDCFSSPHELQSHQYFLQIYRRATHLSFLLTP